VDHLHRKANLVTLSIDPIRTALLVMDYQTDIVGMLGDKAPPVVERAATVIAAARSAKLPVLYIVVGFRPGYPEISQNNKSFSMAARTGRFQTTTPGSDIVAAVRPADGEVVVLKHRVGAFPSTDLDMVLRAKEIRTLILLGLSTSGVVLSTLRHAADADYEIIVASDGCADPDDEVHRVLTEKVFVRQSTVTTCAEIVGSLAG
jgi:nicotinamidase-related amidase